jgi:hypothetical protein
MFEGVGIQYLARFYSDPKYFSERKMASSHRNQQKNWLFMNVKFFRLTSFNATPGMSALAQDANET